MVKRLFCDKCEKEMEYVNIPEHPYFSSSGHMFHYCESCYSFAAKIEKKYNEIIQNLRKEKDKELLNIKPKPWWKL